MIIIFGITSFLCFMNGSTGGVVEALTNSKSPIKGKLIEESQNDQCKKY